VSIQLSKSLLPHPSMSKQEKLKVMKVRQKALSLAALEVVRSSGYEVGPKLGVPGAFAFGARHNGLPTKIGIKTSADRWVGIPRDGAGTWGLLSKVDEVFVVTFDDRYAPSRLQVIAFTPAKLIEMGRKVYAKAEKSGQTGIQWLPLDDQPNSTMTSMAAGHLLPHGTILANEEIRWVDAPPTEVKVSAKPVLRDEGASAPRGMTIADAKAALAVTFGVSPEAVRITIEG
jgi:hypothetical protein